jgi:hypothetical protein
MLFRQTLLTIFFLASSVKPNLFGQIVDRKFSTSELQSDFKILRSRYENNLANLYLYTSKQQLDKLLDSLYINIRPMTELEFYSYITPLSSVVKDGHSNIFISEQSTEKHNKQSRFFPFDIYWTDNKMFITKNLSTDTTIQIGTEILSINGISSHEVMDYLLTRQVRDGNNEQYALWILNNYFRTYFSFHFGHPDKYSLSIKTPDKTEKNVIVTGLSKQTISFNKASRYLQVSNDASTNFRIDSVKNVAVFKISTWDNNNLKREIDFVFLQLQQKKIENLILDLRDNQGGNFSPAIYLLSYLLNHPFQYFTELKSVKKNTDTSQVLKSRKAKILMMHQPKKNPYKGKVYVLINGGCFSNTSSFCSRLELYNRAVFIGEETGGNKVVFCGVFGSKDNIVLPNTKIICDNSNYRLTVSDIKENTGHGVIPTYTITPAITDILQQKDDVLNATFDLIKRQQ